MGIKVEVCNPKFKDENNINYIRILDQSRACHLEEIIDKSRISKAIANSEYGIFTSNIKVLDHVEVIDIGGKIECDDVIYCRFSEFERIYNKLFHTSQINIDKFIRMINQTYDIFEFKIIPDIECRDNVLIMVDGILTNIPYDIFILIVVATVECVNNRNVKNFELIPKFEKEKYLSLKIKMSKKNIPHKGYLSISMDPYLCISGTKQTF